MNEEIKRLFSWWRGRKKNETMRRAAPINTIYLYGHTKIEEEVRLCALLIQSA
jgi:hypothetical protein